MKETAASCDALLRLVFVYSIHPAALKYTSYGKPSPFVFKNAETVLTHVLQSSQDNNQVDGREQLFKTLYMIGDNPAVDIKGARQVCY